MTTVDDIYQAACIAELKREADALGANAVIATTLNYSEISGSGKSMLFVVAVGTAVRLEKNDPKQVNSSVFPP